MYAGEEEQEVVAPHQWELLPEFDCAVEQLEDILSRVCSFAAAIDFFTELGLSHAHRYSLSSAVPSCAVTVTFGSLKRISTQRARVPCEPQQGGRAVAWCSPGFVCCRATDLRNVYAFFSSAPKFGIRGRGFATSVFTGSHTRSSSQTSKGDGAASTSRAWR